MQQFDLFLLVFMFLSSLKTEANIEAMKSIPTERLMIETGELQPVYCNNNEYIWSHWVTLMFPLNYCFKISDLNCFQPDSEALWNTQTEDVGLNVFSKKYTCFVCYISVVTVLLYYFYIIILYYTSDRSQMLRGVVWRTLTPAPNTLKPRFPRRRNGRRGTVWRTGTSPVTSCE